MYVVPETPIQALPAIEAFARHLSKYHPGKYVIVVNDFGACFMVTKRLSTHAPGDSALDRYWLNGDRYYFSEKQIVADQNATPNLR